MPYTREILRTEFEIVRNAWNMLSELKIPDEIIGIGVASNTTRVLSTREPPLNVTVKIMEVILIPWVRDQFTNANPWDNFINKHHQYVSALSNILNSNNPPVRYTTRRREVPWSISAKILDLILIYGLNHNRILRSYFRQNGNLPLDSYSLMGLKKLFAETSYQSSENVRNFLQNGGDLTMGSIARYTNYISLDEIDLYDELQKEVRRFINYIGVNDFYPYHFDRWAYQNELLTENALPAVLT